MLIEDNLNFSHGEMKAQPEVAQYHPANGLTYDEHLAHVSVDVKLTHPPK
ncbi:hypothetical protein [Burkholderia ubonensis]|nr:hypothetical protein [Burkholderia ubonensis]